MGLVLAVVWIAIAVLTKMASVASLAAAMLYVPGFALAGVRAASLWWAGATAVLVAVRHRANIDRLLSGREHTVEGV